MDFFAQQEEAKRRSTYLLFLFSAAIIFVIAAIYIIVVAGLSIENKYTIDAQVLWKPEIFGIVTLAVVTIILTGCIIRMTELQDGGKAVANILGATPININTTDPNLRKLINVVEEMSIASGVPVPEIYLLEEEQGINACVAGYSHYDCVLVVTKGALEQLTRDELQGVIGHEFSHLLNGDMKLNMEMLGLVFGLVCVAEVGRIIFRARVGRSKNAASLYLVALAFLAIGSLGALCGAFIQAAISRQREYLADAASVQFTRNSANIIGALKKIAGFTQHSYLQTPQAHQVNYFLFGESKQELFFESLFATHPDIIDRIHALDPSFDDKSISYFAPAPQNINLGQESRQTMGFVGSTASLIKQSVPGLNELSKQFKPIATGLADSPLMNVANTGATSSAEPLDKDTLEYAAFLKDKLPDEIQRASRELVGGCALILALLISKDEEAQRQQLLLFEGSVNRFVYKETLRLLPIIHTLQIETKLPLVSIIMPVLRQLSPLQYEELSQAMNRLIQADNKIDLFEYALLKIVHRNLDGYFKKVNLQAVKYQSMSDLTYQISVVLSAVAYLTQDNSKSAFEAGTVCLKMPFLSLLPQSSCSFSCLDQALDRLIQASLSIRKTLLEAITKIILFDDKYSVEEQELLRAISDSLGCPLPVVVQQLQVKEKESAV